MKLKEALPKEFFLEFMDTRASKLLEVEVISKVDGTVYGFPGSHKNVYVWWRLADGHAVGMNENPSRGLSFPVVNISPKNCKKCGNKMTRRDKHHRDYLDDELCLECRELNLWDTIKRQAGR